jgi:hypothetical protein
MAPKIPKPKERKDTMLSPQKSIPKIAALKIEKFFF